MYIRDAEKPVLIAFLIALRQMTIDELTNEVQKELRELGEVTPLDINRLESVAEKDDSLNQLYEYVIDILVAGSSERKQGGKPRVNEASEKRSLEKRNYSKENKDTSKDFDIDDEQLLKEAGRIFKATNSNSLAAAKKSNIVRMLEQGIQN